VLEPFQVLAESDPRYIKVDRNPVTHIKIFKELCSLKIQ